MSTELTIIPEVNEKQAKAWLTLAATKNNVTQDLAGREMTLQAILLNKPNDKLAEVLAEYRKQWTEMSEARKAFTSVVTAKLIEPMMEYEKRADPKTNAAYIAASTRELDHRKEATRKLEAQQALATETANFKTHFVNEYLRIMASYRADLAAIITQVYTDCLTVKTPDPTNAIAVAVSAMDAVKPKNPANFVRINLTTQRATELFTAIPQPDYSGALSEAKLALTTKFELYQHDLANAEAAIESNKQQAAIATANADQDIKAQQATNTLFAAAQAFVMPEPGFKGFTERNRIIIRDESQEWVARIMAAFLANLSTVFPLLRVKKYSALNIKQMAEACDTAGIKVEGVDYETIEK